MSITYDVWAFLNNPPVGPQYQYVYIHQKGNVNPGEPLMDYSTYYKGYGQFQFESTIEPGSNLEDIVYDASSPANVNDKRVIDSSVGFTINYSESGGGGAQFDYKDSISQEVYDWQIIEKTSLATTKWTFAQRYPFNWLTRICGADSGDHAPFDYWDRVKDFPNLTRYTLQPQTQSVWRTTKVLKEPVQFNGSVVQSLNYYWWFFVGFDCPPASLYGYESIIVDLSKVSG